MQQIKPQQNLDISHIFSIAAQHPFLEGVARYVHEAQENRTTMLTPHLLLLPNNRIARTFTSLWKTQYPNSLLPTIIPLGNSEALKEHLCFTAGMAEEVKALATPLSGIAETCSLASLLLKEGITSHAKQALRLADSLTQLLATMTQEHVGIAELHAIIPETLALHQQEALSLLHLLLETWPKQLAAKQQQTQASYYNALLNLLKQHIAHTAPHITLAGSTLSQPITQSLADAITACPNGAVILPGYDAEMANTIADDNEIHPMRTMHEWVTKHATPKSLEGITTYTPSISLHAFVEDAEELTWVTEHAIADAKKGIKTAIITPNYYMQHRIHALCAAQGVMLDDAAGEPLLETLPGRFAVALEAIKEQPAQPLHWVSLLQHPHVRQTCEEEKALYQQAIMALESRRYKTPAEALEPLSHIPLCAAMLEYSNNPSSKALITLVETIEHPATVKLTEQLHQLAAQPGNWAIADILRTHLYHPPMQQESGETLMLLSPVEARLLPFESVYLVGMHEGSWPSHQHNPFLSQHMLSEAGMNDRTIRSSLTAHDIYMWSALPHCTVSRAEKHQGALATPSMCWHQLAIMHQVESHKKTETHYIPQQPMAQPAKAPHNSIFPTVLYVTHLELLMRDPFGFFMKHMLNIRPQLELEDNSEMREFGTMLHDALENFSTQVHTHHYLPDEALIESSIAYMQERYVLEDSALHLTRSGITRALTQVMEMEKAALKQHHKVLIEQEGSIILPKSGVTIKARADRIAYAPSKKHVHVYDYKTGTLPKLSDIKAYMAPQLPMEAYIALKGGFAGIEQAEKATIYGIKLGKVTGDDSIQIEYSAEELETYANHIDELLCQFQQGNADFPITPDTRFAPKYNDYSYIEAYA